MLVLLTMGLLSPVQAADTPVINWLSYDKGMALGKSQQKKVFINFFNISVINNFFGFSNRTGTHK